MKKLVSFFVCQLASLIACQLISAVEICRSPEDAARQTLALEGYELCKSEVKEWEQYSIHKEVQLADVQQLADAFRAQVAKDTDTINQLKVLALKPEPKFKILLDPYLYAEGRVMGTSEIARAGIGLDILRWKGLFVYGKAEACLSGRQGSIQEVSTKQQGNFGIYGGLRWHPFR